MKKYSFLLIIILFSLNSVKAQDATTSIGLDLFGGFRNTLELSLVHKPKPFLGIHISGGPQFTSTYSNTYTDELENTSSYLVETGGFFARIGPRFIMNTKSGKESFFAGLNLVYSSWSVSADTETETYYGPFIQNYDAEDSELSMDMNLGVTIHLSDQIAIDLGGRFSSFAPIAFPFVVAKYDHPGVGISASNTEGERPEKDVNFNLFANFKVFLGK